MSAVALVLEATVGFRFGPLVAGICLLTLAGAVVAYGRRRRSRTATAPEPIDLRQTLSGGSTLSALLTVVVLVAAVAAVGAVVSEPNESQAVTEMYLLGERPDGSLSAGAYPVNLTAGTASNYTVGVGAGEDGLDGTVVARLEPAPDVTAGSAVVGQFPVTLRPEESTTIEHGITPERPGDWRLTYRLYQNGTVLREVHVFVSVDPADTAASGAGGGTQ